jgi:hypothetical protein
VDPLADKYPSMSPYMYTAGNPVMLVDPDGMKIFNFYKKRKESYDSNRKDLVNKRDDAFNSGDIELSKQYDKDINRLDRKNKRLIRKYIKVEEYISKLKANEGLWNKITNIHDENGNEVNIVIQTGFVRGLSYLDEDKKVIKGYMSILNFKVGYNGNSRFSNNQYNLKISNKSIKKFNLKTAATVFANIDFEINNFDKINMINVGGKDNLNNEELNALESKRLDYIKKYQKILEP